MECARNVFAHARDLRARPNRPQRAGVLPNPCAGRLGKTARRRATRREPEMARCSPRPLATGPAASRELQTLFLGQINGAPIQRNGPRADGSGTRVHCSCQQVGGTCHAPRAAKRVAARPTTATVARRPALGRARDPPGLAPTNKMNKSVRPRPLPTASLACRRPPSRVWPIQARQLADN